MFSDSWKRYNLSIGDQWEDWVLEVTSTHQVSSLKQANKGH